MLILNDNNDSRPFPSRIQVSWSTTNQYIVLQRLKWLPVDAKIASFFLHIDSNVLNFSSARIYVYISKELRRQLWRRF